MLIFRVLMLLLLTASLGGCLLAAAGAGAEAGYVLTQEDRTAKETMQDQLLVSKVKSALIADSQISGLDINVDSFKGIITLKGVVKNNLDRQKAFDIASNVKGVKGVKTKLFVE